MRTGMNSAFRFARTGRRPLAVRSLLPVDSQPLQVFDHGLGKLTATPMRIEVFVTENENSIVFASPPRSNEKRSCVTEMQISRGGRSESASI